MIFEDNAKSKSYSQNFKMISRQNPTRNPAKTRIHYKTKFLQQTPNQRFIL